MPVTFDQKRFLEMVKKAAFRGVMRATAIVHKEAINLIEHGEKTGRVYVKYRPHRVHQASAPGEAPASDSGNLVKLIQMRFDEKDLVGYVNSGAEYAAYLEFGTRTMEARPYMRVALAHKRVQVRVEILKAVQTALKGATQDG